MKEKILLEGSDYDVHGIKNTFECVHVPKWNDLRMRGCSYFMQAVKHIFTLFFSIVS